MIMKKETRYRKGKRYQKTVPNFQSFLWEDDGWLLVVQIALIPVAFIMHWMLD